MCGQRFLRSICYSKNVIRKLDQLDTNIECAIDISLVETLLGVIAESSRNPTLRPVV